MNDKCIIMLLGKIMRDNPIELSEHYSFSLLIKASNDLGLCVLVSVCSYHTVNIPIIGGSLRKLFCLLHLQEWQEKTDELCKHPIMTRT